MNPIHSYCFLAQNFYKSDTHRIVTKYCWDRFLFEKIGLHSMLSVAGCVGLRYGGTMALLEYFFKIPEKLQEYFLIFPKNISMLSFSGCGGLFYVGITYPIPVSCVFGTSWPTFLLFSMICVAFSGISIISLDIPCFHVISCLVCGAPLCRQHCPPYQVSLLLPKVQPCHLWTEVGL